MFRLIVIILLAFWGLFLFRSCQEVESPKTPVTESSEENSERKESSEEASWKEIDSKGSQNEKSESAEVVSPESLEKMDVKVSETHKISTPTKNYVSLPSRPPVMNEEKMVSKSDLSRDSYIKVYLYDNRIDTFGKVVLTGRINLEIINMSRFVQTLSVDGVKDLGRIKGGESTYMGFEALEIGEYTLVSKNIRGTFEEVIPVIEE